MALIPQGNIRSFYQRYIQIINYISSINRGTPVDERIKNIQIPVTLTHTLAYYFIIKNPSSIGINNFVQNDLMEGGFRGFALEYKSPKINIEVKATGSNTFQRYRPKALLADYIIWINFHSGNLYDVAVFDPKILNPNNKNEVEFNWNKLLQPLSVNFFPNIPI